eukprot:m.217793 g.217793  ORF g.217793 m.217793 type:complete len:699 (-) comp22241_c0_seq9:25-2121(-)
MASSALQPEFEELVSSYRSMVQASFTAHQQQRSALRQALQELPLADVQNAIAFLSGRSDTWKPPDLARELARYQRKTAELQATEHDLQQQLNTLEENIALTKAQSRATWVEREVIEDEAKELSTHLTKIRDFVLGETKPRYTRAKSSKSKQRASLLEVVEAPAFQRATSPKQTATPNRHVQFGMQYESDGVHETVRTLPNGETSPATDFLSPQKRKQGSTSSLASAEPTSSVSDSSRSPAETDKHHSKKWKPVSPIVRCVKCNKTAFYAERVEANGQIYHKGCMRCVQCKAQLSLGNFRAAGRSLYCRAHYTQAFLIKGSYEDIEEQAASAASPCPPYGSAAMDDSVMSINAVHSEAMGNASAPPPYLEQQKEDKKDQVNPKMADAAHSRALPHFFSTHTAMLRHTCQQCKETIGFHQKFVKCSVCGLVCHPQCENDVPGACEAPPPASPWKNKIFRSADPSLSLLLAAGNDAIPYIVAACVLMVETKFIETEGLYRLSGQSQRVNELKGRFFRGNHQPSLSSVDDPHEITGCLKSFLRGLDEPVIPFAAYDTFIQVPDAESEHTQRAALSSALQQLPAVNYHTLRALARHLRKVARYSHVNKMKVSNLAVVFAPVLMRSPEGTLHDAHHNGTQRAVMELLFSTDSETWAAIDALRGSADSAPASPKTPKSDKKRRKSPFGSPFSFFSPKREASKEVL